MGPGKSTTSSIILSDLLQKEDIKAFDWDLEFHNIWSEFYYDPAVVQGVTDSTNEKFRNHLASAFEKKQDVSFETNFHDTEGVLKHISTAKENGFRCILSFLFVDNITTCIERVRSRVRRGWP